jgi:hypothetical protein
MLIYPRLPSCETMVKYLQNATSLDIDFIEVEEKNSVENPSDLELHCFHAYCAALRGVTQ